MKPSLDLALPEVRTVAGSAAEWAPVQVALVTALASAVLVATSIQACPVPEEDARKSMLTTFVLSFYFLSIFVVGLWY